MESSLHWIFFTGAPYTGKSTAARILEGKLNLKYPNALIKIESMIEPVAKMAMGLFDVKDSYLQFKRNTYYGKTGREWIIRLTEDVVRKPDRTILDKILVDRVTVLRQHNLRPTFIICENLGFLDEHTYFRQRVAENPDEKFTLIYMSRDGFPCGNDNDSREDLMEHADHHIRHPDHIVSLIPHLV